MGARVAVEFSAVEWERAGEGCRAGSGVVSAATKFSIRVGPEPAGPKRGLERPAKQCVDAVALELGGVAEHAARLVQSARQRLPGGPTLKTEPSAGAVISGLPGVGKTRLARAVASAMGLHLEFVDAASIFQTLVGHSEVELVKTFERALQQSPSILVIDGIEAIAASRHAAAESDSALEVGVLGTLLACLDRIKKESQPVFVVGATTRPEDLDAAVVSNGRMDVAVKIEPPTQPQRREILSIMTSAWQSSNLNESYLSQLSDATGGFVGADLLSLCQRALQSSLNDSEARSTDGPTVLPRHFEEALASTYPSALQAHSVSKVVPAESNATTQDQSPFSKVFGLDQAIEAIKVSLIEPLEDCSRFLTYGTVPPKGILLTGPPGSGKSHLALAVASEVQRRGLASFVSVRCTDLLTKVVGDTEKALRELFATARNAAPCVLYFDQIESIAPVRGFDTSTEQTFDRMLSMLLVEMDGFNSSRSRLQSSQTSAAARAAFLKEHVVILASTGNKEQLDPAILRPGRFDVHVELAYPDEAARFAIALDSLSTVPVAYDQDPSLGSPEAVAALVARHTGGQSAGDISALFREAAMASLREDLSAARVAVQHVTRALTPEPLAADPSPAGDGRMTDGRGSAAAAGAPLHERNRYRLRPPDFYALGAQYPRLRPHLRGVDDEEKRASVAWDDPHAVRELTATLLRHDFGLEWTMPIDRLCPPVPNRLNYLHWVEDLLSLTGLGGTPDADRAGIDVGTGASCIYALLGAKMNGWRFLATEIDPVSVDSARANVARNALEDRITIRQTYTNCLLTEPLEGEPADRKFDFTICNPPFFDHMDEADTNPSNCCMGSDSEMVFPGGEVSFIGIMIQESVALRDRITWFTSMIGRKSSLRKLLAMLREHQVPTFRTTEFFQGRTKRWGIAWTFAEAPAPDASAKVLGKRKEAHRRQDMTFEVLKGDGKGCTSIEDVEKRLEEFAASMSELDLTRVSSDSTAAQHSFSLVQRKQDSEDNSAPGLFNGKIHVSQCEEKEAFNVLVVFEKGERAEFWRTTERMAAAVVRKGRKWRRQAGGSTTST